jgi:uncharacterized membrane protein YuzA (DUF378 family)
MISIIAFILTIVGALNWFFIGILQYDFVAGLFGSQANLFSRIVYFLVGIAGIVVVANFITNKGKFMVSFGSAQEDYNEMKRNTKTTARKRKLSTATESAKDYHINTKHSDTNAHHGYTNSSINNEETNKYDDNN